ncbi:MAG: PLP-dependent lyase/thiolase [Candidatus Pacebacteria bacterium]|nr:PLP-dependent lyase/thiolase [Candidatus Paceibacterota bacterium]
MEIVVQDESRNPYGTHKDRRSQYIVAQAKKEGVTTLCLITSGNAGYSLAKYARPEGIEVVCIIDHHLSKEIKEPLTRECSKVVEADLTGKVLKPEEVVALARTNEEEVLWDVTNGYAAAYAAIIKDITVPYDYLVCPVGSGELYVGLAQGLREHGKRVQLIGIGVKTHPSFADKLSAPWTPYQGKMKEIEGEGNPIIRLTEEEVRAVYDEYKDRYVCEPSSAVVWAARTKAGLPQDARVVVVNSGRGLL